MHGEFPTKEKAFYIRRIKLEGLYCVSKPTKTQEDEELI
jgi:hypothetical protein